METITLSAGASAILFRRLADEWVEVTEETRPLYRELVEAGAMIPINTFLGGAEGFYRLTEAAPKVASENSPSSAIPSPEGSLSRAG